MITKDDLILIEELTSTNNDKKFKKLNEKVTLLLKGLNLQEQLNDNAKELEKFKEVK